MSDQRHYDWIIYYNESVTQRYVKYIAVGSKAIGRVTGTVIKGFHGTRQEVMAEADRLNRQYIKKFKEEDHARYCRKAAGEV